MVTEIFVKYLVHRKVISYKITKAAFYTATHIGATKQVQWTVLQTGKASVLFPRALREKSDPPPPPTEQHLGLHRTSMGYGVGQ